MPDEESSLQDEIAEWLSGAHRNGDGPAHGFLTEATVSARLIRSYGAELRYCDLWKRWLRWKDGRWQDDDTGYAPHLVQETLRGVLRDASDVIDPDMRKRAIREIVAMERAGRLRGALEIAAAWQPHAITPAQLDADLWAFNVRNGTIDLRTGELRPHDRGALITKQAPVDYAAGAPAPAFRAFLERVVPDPDLRHFLRRAVGYSLAGSTSEQILLILHGSGSNGKSTITELLLDMLGDYAQQAPPETFLEQRNQSIPNDVARLRGARFVSASEISEGKRLNEALVKRMTGGDTMTARFMRAEYFEFKPQFTPWLATNHRPEIRGTDHAIWRRVKLVPFNERIPDEDQDHDLPAKLRAELPGILAWAVRGCLDWQLDGLQEPEIVKAATREYRADQDVLGPWLEERCKQEAGAGELSADLYRSYHDWAKAQGEQPLEARVFGRRLGEKGYQAQKTSRGRTWKGLRLTTDQEDLGF